MATVKFTLGAKYDPQSTIAISTPSDFAPNGSVGFYTLGEEDGAYLFGSLNGNGQYGVVDVLDSRGNTIDPTKVAVFADYSDNTGTVYLNGGDKDDILLGGSGEDILTGGNGADTLNGGSGEDVLIGGAGNDTYVVDNAGDEVTERDGFGKDTILTSISYTLSNDQSIETLRLLSSTGTTDLDLTGNGSANTLLGNGGKNVLDGKGGADTMQGFAGDDTYHVDNAKDLVIESANGGKDLVLTDVSYTLRAGSSVEVLQAEGKAAINLTGNALDNLLIGNDSDNRLNGGGGNDTLQGGAGNDTYTVDINATILETADASGGNDTVIATGRYFALSAGVGIEKLQLSGSAGGSSQTSLYGNELDQRLIGNAGANYLDGAAGNDLLQGLGGNDTFGFTTALGTRNVDHVRDFTVGADRIGLGFDGAYGLTTDPDGRLTASSFADITQGPVELTENAYVLYDGKTGTLSFDADGSGATAAVTFAVLDNRAGIHASDIGLLVS